MRDREKPRIETARRIVVVEVSHHVQPGLLEQVIGRGLIVDQPHKVAIEPLLILADSLSHRGGVAAAQACDLSGWFRHGKTLVDSRLVNHNRIGYTGTPRKKTQRQAPLRVIR